ncbi:fibroblast growth factor receptor substrate 3 [Galendromus occidentalis]|uniref:Fibroblast growth factor receptor substrate 3 n=1 Tax=Galendromus occidentalis TaxID=34638 RepID=A0AAJ7SGZ7_9ACAR|nr:fibroblast growth factor receptor substrate 3 [Galendromus occidentalis]
MGNCVSPETDDSSFAVWNVDDGGNRVQPGRISLTETHLVFVQKAGEPIRWPLSGLRRYGFDAELFSFESGRRCPTGSGVYAFKCPRAERLFNLLQERIQAQAPIRPNSLIDSPPTPQELRTTADYLEPISLGAQVVSTVNFVNNVSPLGAAGAGPVYQNVPVQNQQQQRQSLPQQGIHQNQAAQEAQVPPASSANALASMSNGSKDFVASMDSLTAPGVNYVVLDLDQPSEPPTPTSPTTPTPAIASATPQSPSAPLGYAQIDFDKTMALQHIASRSRTSDL